MNNPEISIEEIEQDLRLGFTESEKEWIRKGKFQHAELMHSTRTGLSASETRDRLTICLREWV